MKIRRQQAAGDSTKKTPIIIALQLFMFTLACGVVQGQQTKSYRMGVLIPGEAWYEIVDGLRTGLNELGLHEGKQFSLEIHDWKENVKAAEAAARNLEEEKVSLIYTTSTNSTIAAKRATTETSIVFAAGKPSGCGARGELRKTRRKAHWYLPSDYRSHCPAAGDAQGNYSEAPSNHNDL